MKPDLLILTNNFPNAPHTSEGWLEDEIRYTNQHFNTIYLLPEFDSGKYIDLPKNCKVIHLEKKIDLSFSFKEKLNCFFIVISDLFYYPSKLDFLKAFRSNLALIKNLSLKAKNINKHLSNINSNTIVYAYWADNLLTTACILKQQYKDCKIVARGHGFEIFEEQTKYGVIPFRQFQNKFSNKIFADSKRGHEHLLRKAPELKIYDHSYVGTLDKGEALFDPNEIFTIVTCSHLRNVKRLHLMADILEHISFPLVWNIIGDGPDMELLKSKNSNLPKHIKINYLGNLDNRAVLEFLKTKHTNLFVSLSYSEGLPVSMMEAISFGIPILSTDVGGCREICNDKTGILIERDFDGRSVASLISDFKTSEKNSFGSRKQIREFWKMNFNAEINYKKFADQLLKLNEQ